MKLKNKGKVYPSPSPSPSSSGEDFLSVLKLLPAAILALATVLSLEDREVLAYMITRSLRTTTTNSCLISQHHSSKKKSSKKAPSTAANLTTTQKTGGSSHKQPVFYCDCFDCYTSYWCRWDSSVNRELIHQVIEAFEEHLNNGEAQRPSKKNTRPKRRDANSKSATGLPDIPVLDIPPGQPDHEVPVLQSSTEEALVLTDDVVSTEENVKEEVDEVTKEMIEEFPVSKDSDVEERTTETSETAAETTSTITTTSNHKGLARKVLPDVLGLFNSRLWGLWNPNV